MSQDQYVTVSARLGWLDPAEGGRVSGKPITDRYLANCVLGDELFSVIIDDMSSLRGGALLENVDVTFIARDLVMKYLVEGAELRITEGPVKVVARGVVLGFVPPR